MFITVTSLPLAPCSDCASPAGLSYDPNESRSPWTARCSVCGNASLPCPSQTAAARSWNDAQRDAENAGPAEPEVWTKNDRPKPTAGTSENRPDHDGIFSGVVDAEEAER